MRLVETSNKPASGIPLRALIVEDSHEDTLLLVHELRRGGYSPEYQLVNDKVSMRAALAQQKWDIVITKYRLPNFSSQAALNLVKAHGVDIPVIVVSGSIREEFVAQVLRSGVQDYVLKVNLRRLIPVIERELRDAEVRRAHRTAEDTVRYLVNHDQLTGLNNRTEFGHRLQRALSDVSNKTPAHALLYIDLDQFKVINDTCGHGAGDQLLKELTQVLQKTVRKQDTLARLGGDEFGVLLEDCPLRQAKRVAENILKKIKSFRFQWQDVTYSVGASIGLVTISETQSNYHDVLSAADMACYEAKDLGRNRIHVYNKDDSSLIQRHGDMKWVAQIHQALHQDRFFLNVQRIVSLSNPDAPACFEFLLRMRHTDNSVIQPGSFIPAAERYNFMTAIDRWVIDRAFAYLARQMRTQNPGRHFINLSGHSLSDGGLYAYIWAKLKEYGVAPELICFEITETAAITHVKNALGFISAVRNEGCSVALDDFGAGLSSFSYLKSMKVDYLKIDGSFIIGLLQDRMDRAIVESITRIGHEAGLQIVAEFVENDVVRDELIHMGLDYAQGYGIERPTVLSE